MDHLETLRGKVAIVTGATGGLGRVVVRHLLDAGAAGAALTGFRADVTVEADIRALVDDALHRHGRIDVLLNLAGGYRGGAEAAASGEADWNFLMRLNLKSVFLCCRAVLPVMTKAGTGRIVNIAARPAIEKRGRAKAAAYAVSKADVVVLTEAIAEEVRKTGVTVNCVVPGTIDTAKNRALIPDGDFGKWANPGDIAEVLLFLASGASSVVSGAVIPVYGKS